MASRRLAVAMLLVVLFCLPPSGTSFAAKVKAKTKKKVAAKSAPVRGFGAPAAGKKGGPLPSFGDAALDQAIAQRCDALKKQKKNEQHWLALGALLVKAKEYAEAERIFRAGAAQLPGSELLSAAALTLGGDSAAYCRGGTSATDGDTPELLRATSPFAAAATDDASFEAYEAPPSELLAYDQADRHVDWSADAAGAAARGAVFKSKKPLLDPADCAWAIEQVEAQAAISGWTQDRHVQAPTTDIPVSAVPAIREWFDDALTSTLFPMIAARFPHLVRSPAELRVFDAFVVRYDAREQASLPTHVDENTFSFTIALNDRDEYEGGGTVFSRLRRVGDTDAEFGPTVLNADAGGCVAFPGKLRHGGNVVTAGRRYIIPLFLYADANKLHGAGRPAPGYVLRHLGISEPDGAEGLSRYAQEVVAARGG